MTSLQFYELILSRGSLVGKKKETNFVLHMDHLHDSAYNDVYIYIYDTCCLSHNCVSMKKPSLSRKSLGPWNRLDPSAKALWSSSSRHKERTSHHPPVHRWATTTEQPCGVPIQPLKKPTFTEKLSGQREILATVPWTFHAFSMCYLQLELCILYFFSAKNLRREWNISSVRELKFGRHKKVGELWNQKRTSWSKNISEVPRFTTN